MKNSLVRSGLMAILTLFVALAALQAASAQDDAVHVVSGIVKHLDRAGKTIVVKTDDGVEHTVKWTDKTTWDATKQSGKGIKEGSKVAVKYTEKAGEKTAVGVKDVGKDTDKALQ
jgi:Cu/Ag efflux protein CusF